MGGLDHEVILVQLEGKLWVCDAGFGGHTPRAPVQLVDPPLAREDVCGEGQSNFTSKMHLRCVQPYCMKCKAESGKKSLLEMHNTKNGLSHSCNAFLGDGSVKVFLCNF